MVNKVVLLVPTAISPQKVPLTEDKCSCRNDNAHFAVFSTTLKPRYSEQDRQPAYPFGSLYRIIHYIKCDMLSKSLKWELGFCSLYHEIHYIEVRYIKVLVYYTITTN